LEYFSAIVEAIILSIGRVLTFVLFTVVGSLIGALFPTLSYQDHTPMWDSFASLFPYFVISLLVPYGIIYFSDSKKWRTAGVLLTVVFSFLPAWAICYIFTK